MQADQRLERLVAERARCTHVGESQPLVALRGLRALELHLELAAPIRSLAGQKRGGIDAQFAAERLEQTELGFAPPILDQGKLARHHADPFTELFEGETRLCAEETKSLAEHQSIELSLGRWGNTVWCHNLTIRQKAEKFTPDLVNGA
ncbi:hypothetical protein GCM10009693_18710 [Leucobacter chromiireducens subsp. chromiireducens]